MPQRAVAQDLLGQLDAADLRGPVLIDRSDAEFGNPHTFPVLLRLQQDGVAFTFDNDPDVARFGTGRADGGRARQQLSLVTGGPASEPHPGATRIAFTSPATRVEAPTVEPASYGTAALFLTPIR